MRSTISTACPQYIQSHEPRHLYIKESTHSLAVPLPAFTIPAQASSIASETSRYSTPIFDMQAPQDQREGSQENGKSFPTFPFFSRFPREIRDQIWEETFSQQRIFDNDTLRRLKPQNGIMYSYLTPYALYVCQASREFAQRRLRRSYLLRSWPKKFGRVIYFKPECDVRVYQSTQLHWQPDGQCLFSCVKIIADASPEDLASNTRHGLRSEEFHEKFPNLKRVIVTDRQLNLDGEVIRNRWTEERWKRVKRDTRTTGTETGKLW
ncbi:hypothetical protein DL98DRAFT_540198 [Cadophora sp. DSE1049]|nr:hypothetical protein DL98DRAFT_540198 [Cadophora sp. DSE1049]